jgi:hypothetical protein
VIAGVGRFAWCVILSASTARLVEDAPVLAAPGMVRIIGASDLVVACRLLGMRQDRTVSSTESNLVGRAWETLNAGRGLDRLYADVSLFMNAATGVPPRAWM